MRCEHKPEAHSQYLQSYEGRRGAVQILEILRESSTNGQYPQFCRGQNWILPWRKRNFPKAKITRSPDKLDNYVEQLRNSQTETIQHNFVSCERKDMDKIRIKSVQNRSPLPFVISQAASDKLLEREEG